MVPHTFRRNVADCQPRSLVYSPTRATAARWPGRAWGRMASREAWFILRPAQRPRGGGGGKGANGLDTGGGGGRGQGAWRDGCGDGRGGHRAVLGRRCRLCPPQCVPPCLCPPVGRL